MADININENRLWRSIQELGQIGERDGGAMMRVTGSEADGHARDQIIEWFEEAGLSVKVDPLGNIVGRREGRVDTDPVMTGSHVDTVPDGGKFDGTAGVLTALEAIRAWNDVGYESERPIELVVFTEEEGTRFGVGLLGSLVATGKLSQKEALSLKDDKGNSLENTLERIGYRGEASLDFDRAVAFLELHVEQGPVLDAENLPIGIVDAIAGITHHRVTFKGETDHAGNTPMDQRRDAFAGASEFTVGLESVARQSAERSNTVGTVGKCIVSPNGTNVIPGTVELGVDIRDTDDEVLSSTVNEVNQIARECALKRELSVAWETLLEVDPTAMADNMTDHLVEACEACGLGYKRMLSGAGHDAMNVADVAPTGMLFVPSVDGVSHSLEEFTRSVDLAKGAAVLERTLRTLADTDITEFD